MFSEILHGLIGRTQQEAGICENDPSVTLQPCSLHIGIIPAGKVPLGFRYLRQQGAVPYILFFHAL